MAEKTSAKSNYVSKLSDLKPYVKETLALQDIFLSLGYDQDELFAVCSNNGLGISILKNGEHHTFPSALRPPELTRELFVEEWLNAIQIWNVSPQDERHQLVLATDVRQRAALLIAQLVDQDLIPKQAINLPCPFCGRHLFFDSTISAAGHIAPPCQKFVELDSLEFLKACRYAIEGN